MGKFITDQPLRDKLSGIITNAQELLVIVSPYIKFDNDIKRLIGTHRNNRNVHILIICRDIPQNYDDYKFLQTFPNIRIIIEEDLHAKYYANEIEGLMTSMNLYSHSTTHNVEYGYYSNFMDQSDNDAFYHTMKLANTKLRLNQIEYENMPTRTRFSMGYPQSGNDKQYKTNDKYSKHKGYCIRCGCKIEFNIERPMCYDCYQSWSWNGGRTTYPEKFCHYSGEDSFGKTTMGKPILSKNWNKF